MSAEVLKNETRLSLKEAITRFPFPVTEYDLYNWRARGVPVGKKRVYLGWLRIASRVWTTVEAIERFIKATNGE
jgi:hypothetical protein